MWPRPLAVNLDATMMSCSNYPSRSLSSQTVWYMRMSGLIVAAFLSACGRHSIELNNSTFGDIENVTIIRDQQPPTIIGTLAPGESYKYSFTVETEADIFLKYSRDGVIELYAIGNFDNRSSDCWIHIRSEAASGMACQVLFNDPFGGPLEEWDLH